MTQLSANQTKEGKQVGPERIRRRVEHAESIWEQMMAIVYHLLGQALRRVRSQMSLLVYRIVQQGGAGAR